MIETLIPIIGAKLTDTILNKFGHKLSVDAIKESASSYIKSKYENSSYYKNKQKRKEVEHKKQLNLELKQELQNLKKNKAKDIDTILKHMKKISDLEYEIDTINSKKIKEEKTRLTAINKLKDYNLIKPRKTKKKLKTEDTEKTDKLNELDKIPKEDTTIKTSNTSKLKEYKTNLNTIEKEKKPLKNLKSDYDLSQALTTPELASGVTPFASSEVSDLESNINGPINTQLEVKNLKITSKLLLNSEKQLKTLENIEKGIKNMPQKDGLLDTLLPDAGGKGGWKAKLLAVLGFGKKIVKNAGKLAGPAAITYEVGSGIMDYKHNNSEYKKQYEAGQITEQEYNRLKKRNKFSSGGKVGGALAAAAGGAAIGTAFFPGIGTLGGAAIGGISALIGGHYGQKGGESLDDYLATTAYLESGFNPNEKAKKSSATGMYQFTDKTWSDLVKKHNKDYTLEDRYDPTKSLEMAALLAQENKDHIEKKTGKTASNTDLYMGHFLGAPGASKFINEKENNPDAIANAKFSEQARSNPAIFYKKDGTPRTYAEIHSLMDNKFKEGSKISNELLSKATIPTDTIINKNGINPEVDINKVNSNPVNKAVSMYDVSKKEQENKILAQNTQSEKASPVINNYTTNNTSPAQQSQPIDDYISNAIRIQVNN